jgi:hypothetical protein
VKPDPAIVEHAADYVGTYAAPDGTKVVVSASGNGAQVQDGGSAFRLYARDADEFWTDDPRFALFTLKFYRNAEKVVTDFTSGPTQFVNASYRGPTTYAYPAWYETLTGRYETTYYGDTSVTRVVEVKGRLTLDGTTPLSDQGNGTFRAGHSIVRFGHVLAGKAQRMWFDAIPAERIELP